MVAGQEVISTLTKLSASLSSAVTSLRGNVNMDIPDIDFERGVAMIKVEMLKPQIPPNSATTDDDQTETDF